MEREQRTLRRPFPVLPGLGGLLRGELSRWLGRRGLVHLIAWSVAIQGWMYWDTVVDAKAMDGWRGFDALIQMWWIMAPLAAIGIAQNALLEERHNDTTAWVLSKPVSRPAFVVSKILGDAMGLIAIAVVLQGTILYLWLPRVDPDVGLKIMRPDLGRYAAVLGVLSLAVLFFVALTICITTIVPWRGPAAAVGLMVWGVIWAAPTANFERFTMGGLVTGEFDSPRRMKPIAEYLVFDTPLEPTSSIVWTLIAAVAFTVLGALVFRRQQF